MPAAVVVGGGIGGLSAALALHRTGWRVTVLERAAGFREIGAGLALWPNAMRALAALELDERVRAIATAETTGWIRDRGGRRLLRTHNAEVARRHGWPLLMVHRADLLRVLVAALPAALLRPGAEVRAVRAARQDDAALIEHQDGPVVVEYQGGRERADLVVGADGVGSVVRRLCWPEAAAPLYSGHTAWRAVTSPIGGQGPDGELFWGRGERFGFAALPGGRFYCFAAARAAEGGGGDPYTEVMWRFGDWPEPVPRLLAAVPRGSVLRHDVYEAPPLESYARGRVALLGDAAHAMEPTLGQGAGTALEDAVTLAACLSATSDVAAALARYDRERRPRTRAIVRRSARLGATALIASRPGAWLRDLGARLLPGGVPLRAMDPVLSWTPPSLTAVEGRVGLDA